MGTPHVSKNPAEVICGPLVEASHVPDVVLCRINGLALMTLKDTFPDLQVEGKPHCHIIAIAKEQSRVVASVGCALSRARTGMKSQEMTCALPGDQIDQIADMLEGAVALDKSMARCAADDARRFSSTT